MLIINNIKKALYKSLVIPQRQRGRKGIKIRIGGRIKGVAKARFKKWTVGPIGTSTITKPVFYSSRPIYTKWGIMGLKFWKGY